MIDCTAPVAGVVGFVSSQRGMPALTSEAFCSPRLSSVFGSWSGFEDRESNVTKYSYALVSFANATVPNGAVPASAAAWRSAGYSTFVRIHLDDLLDAPAMYRLLVRGLCK